MKKIIALLLLLPCFCLADSGMYNFQGLSWDINRPDSAATFSSWAGYWQETFGNSLTILPTGGKVNTDEESFGVGILQGTRLWKQLVVGGGFLAYRYDNKHDHNTPTDYFMVRMFSVVFLQSLRDDWHGRWGFGVVFDYVPGMKQRTLTLGIVGLF